MVGVLFIVTIPTEQEERIIELNEKHVKFGHSSNVDISNQESDKFEYGTFKVVSDHLNFVFVPFKCIFLSSFVQNLLLLMRWNINGAKINRTNIMCPKSKNIYRILMTRTGISSDFAFHSFVHLALDLLIIVG